MHCDARLVNRGNRHLVKNFLSWVQWWAMSCVYMFIRKSTFLEAIQSSRDINYEPGCIPSAQCVGACSES